MKILLISGHGAGDPGAIGNGYKEADLTIEVVKGIKPILEAYATVDVYPYDRNAFTDIQNGNLKVNFANYDYVLEIHFNSFNGSAKGTEIFVTTKEKASTVEQKIVNNLSNYFSNRGVKVTDFLVIKTAKNKGVSSALLEVCFIDNANDMKVFQSNKSAIYKTIADGIAEGFGLKSNGSTPQPPKPSQKSITEVAKEVINGKYGNGQDRINNLKKAGYDPNAVQAEVNRLLGATQPSKKSIDEIAREVIYGKWGNGSDRKNRLEKAGYNYNEVQNKVNQLL